MGTFECKVSCQNVAFLENTHLILDMINKEHKKEVVSSFQNDPKTKRSAQGQSKVKEEAPLSLFAHQKAHTHVFQTPFSFLWEESGQVITTSYEADVEVKNVEIKSSCLKEEFAIIPHYFEERKLYDASFPPLFVERQEVFNHVVQDHF